MSSIILFAAGLLARVQEFCHERLRFNIRGLGVVLRRLRQDAILHVRGKRLYLNHKVADNYGRLVAGRFNEPETHAFLDRVMAQAPAASITFIEVGANVGEFVLDYGNHRAVNEFIAFEPQIEQFRGISETIRLNAMPNARAINLAVCDMCGAAAFHIPRKNASSSGLSSAIGENLIEVGTTTLDTEITFCGRDLILLIDVEGAELRVMKGASKLIAEAKPLIVFEYNYVTCRHFSIESVGQFLGDQYAIYRLCRNGALSNDTEAPGWNMIAVPRGTRFSGWVLGA